MTKLNGFGVLSIETNKTRLRARPVVNEGVNIKYGTGSPCAGNVRRRGRAETNE